MVIMGLLCLPALVMSRGAVVACLRSWLGLVEWGLKAICGITYSVEGMEHLPEGGALIASKHQAMFETLFFWKIFPDPAIILKKELSRLPIFGWYAMALRNIAVDRDGAARALKDMTRQAGERIAEGRQIVIFPEGTRTAPGEQIAYKPGVVSLYKRLHAPCVPVALNSGLVWPAKGLPAGPGHITIRILPPLPPGLDKKEFLATLEGRIEQAAHELLPATDRHQEAPTS